MVPQTKPPSENGIHEGSKEGRARLSERPTCWWIFDHVNGLSIKKIWSTVYLSIVKEQCISQLDCLIKIEDVSGYQVDSLQWLMWLKFKKKKGILMNGDNLFGIWWDKHPFQHGWFPSVKALKHTSKLCDHSVNLVITSCMEDCHYDNIQCSLWWECCTMRTFLGQHFT